MRYVYEALFCMDESNVYYGYIPDVPECQASSYSYQEAIESLCDQLEAALSKMLCAGSDVPTAHFDHKVYDGFFSTFLSVYADDSANYQVVSAAQAAEMLGVSRPRITALVKSGQLQGYREGRNSWIYLWSVQDRLYQFSQTNADSSQDTSWDSSQAYGNGY